jgi:hypothetical protein
MELILSVLLAALGVANTWLLFAIKSFRDELNKLQTADKELRDMATRIEVLVAGQYITRDEFRAEMRAQTDSIIGSIRALYKQQAQQVTG